MVSDFNIDSMVHFAVLVNQISINLWLRQVTGWLAETVLPHFPDQERCILLNPIHVINQQQYWPFKGFAFSWGSVVHSCRVLDLLIK
jgi:hypothetical protein